MTENTKAAEATKTEKPEFILTKSGVMIVGSELIGEKMTAILCEVLASSDIFDDTGITTVVLRNDGFPIDTDETPMFGMAFADTHSLSINLDRCWNSACKTAAEGKKHLGFMGILWINVLQTFGHEMDHLAVAWLDRVLYETMRRDEDGCKELEASGNESAVQMIVQMSKKFDVEIPMPVEMGWFGTKWMELNTTINTKDLEWVIKARKMVEEGIVYEKPENDIKIPTFREFVKLAHDPDSEDEVWEQPTTPVNLEVHLDNGAVEVIKAEPVKEPKVDNTDEQRAAFIEAADKAEAVEMQQTAAGTFVSAGEDLDKVAEAACAAVRSEATPIENDGARMAEDAVVMTDAVDSNGQPTIGMETAAADSVQTTTVTLPEPAAAQQAQLTAAAATAVPPTAPAPTTYTPNNMTPEAMSGVMKGVWQSLYHHLFTKCGWQLNPTTGRYFFAAPAAVLEGVNIMHILTQFGADNFIIEYDTLNAQGQFAPEMCQGMIRGYMTSKQGLPAYSIYLNIAGRRIKRTFLPQNPEKKNAQNAYTQSAEEAGQGHVIAWVFKDEVADGAPFKEKCAVKMYDNSYEVF